MALVFDVSLSMDGHLGNSLIEALVTTISALSQMGLDNFVLIAFGEKVRICTPSCSVFDVIPCFVAMS